MMKNRMNDTKIHDLKDAWGYKFPDTMGTRVCYDAWKAEVDPDPNEPDNLEWPRIRISDRATAEAFVQRYGGRMEPYDDIIALYFDLEDVELDYDPFLEMQA